tara:strand:+ start:18721 stop:19752 length:1032 start_codon:yes stop_codon:yes gene_type:complete
MNKVSIIIPHYNNFPILDQCLKSLENITYSNLEIIVIDNNSYDDSFQKIKNNYKNLILKKSLKNLGYTGGCNLGASFATGDYLLFLNNDTVQDPHFLNYMVDSLDKDEKIASVQSKIKNFKNKDLFDYAGACGGYIDYLVFPFCRGRIFNTVEKDIMQYEESRDVFWTSGTAFLTRKSIFINMGGFDEKLFAHMEEIDYCWKCNLANYKCIVNPKSVVYHEGAKTLGYDSPYKTYLNHRNSMILLLSNYQFINVIKIFPLRIILEIISSIKDLFSLKIMHFFSHYLAIISLFNIFYLFRRRRIVRKIRVNDDSDLFNKKIIYSNSIVWSYFIKRKYFFNDILS